MSTAQREARELLTFREVCERAGIPESTGRFYRKRHGAFIPVTGKGRNRRYTVQAVEVLRAIAGSYQSGATATETQQMLSRSFPMSTEHQEVETQQAQREPQRNAIATQNGEISHNQALAVIAQQQQVIITLLERTAGALDASYEREKALEKVAGALERASARDAETAYLMAELARLKQKMRDEEERRQQSFWQKIKDMVKRTIKTKE
jgi:DNA-binding transcriptional MerR regulator